MASTNRGGMKQSDKNNPSGSKKHQGVRPGSTATRKERHQAENRKPAFDEEQEKKALRRSKKSAAVNPERQPAKRKKGPAAKKLKDQPPEKRGEIKAGTGKKNLYANMPKARKVR
jgi:hypothetical protein